MAVRITIHENAASEDRMADLLRHVASLIDQGFTSGYYPGWTLADEPDDPDADISVCHWCGEEIGIIHYGDGDRWQPTPALGDDLCEVRAELATDDGVYRHEPADYRNRV